MSIRRFHRMAEGAPYRRSGFHPLTPLNRSSHHPFATQYAQARAMAMHLGAEVQRQEVA